MKTNIKKTACAVIAGTVFFAMTGCSAAAKSGEETTSKDPSEEVMEVAEDYCKALADTDADKIIDLSADDLGDLEDQLRELLDLDSGAYSDDMSGILHAIADTIEYEIDEDSLAVDEEKGEASVDVTFDMFDYVSNDFTEDVDTLEEAQEAIADGEKTTVELTLELEETDDGWKVTGTDDVLDAVYDFMIMGALAPDFTYDGADVSTTVETGVPDASDATADISISDDEPLLSYIDGDWFEVVGYYGDVEFDPSYIVRLDYSDHYVEFSGSYLSCVDDWDFERHTGYVDSSSYTYFEIAVLPQSDIDDPDYTGFAFVIEHDDTIEIRDVSDMDATSMSDLGITVSAEDFGGDAWTGSYVISLTDPLGRTVWQAHIQVE